MKKSLLISAYNVRSGGGLVLLKMLLENFPDFLDVHLLCDENFEPSLESPQFKITKYKKSITARIRAEYYIYKNSFYYDKILCFGNLPPLFPSNEKVTVFLQNRFLVSKNFINPVTPLSIVRSIVEKAWFHSRVKRYHQVLVQTPSMQELTQKTLGANFKVDVLPFFNMSEFKELKNSKKKDFFIYISSSDPHKNHFTLLEAWRILQKEGRDPKLLLIFSGNPKDDYFLKVKEYIHKYSLNVETLTNITREECLENLSHSKALLYPSLLESFGLPLLEACSMETPVIAANLAYVFDVITPSRTFDPKSAESISNCIRNFNQGPESKLNKTILSSKDFLKTLFN